MDDDIKLRAKVGVNEGSAELELQGSQKALHDFFDGLVPDFVKDGVGILSDQVKLWRWENQVRIIRKAQVVISSSGLPKQKIPLKVLVPIIENSSLEEDTSMQEKWSHMLANAATGNVEISPNYVAILSELSPVEVRILDGVYDEAQKENDYERRKSLQFDSEKLKPIFGISTSEEMDLIVENLYRLNLLQAPAGNGIMVGDFKFALRTTRVFEFTTLGFEFVKACRWN